MSSFGGTFFTLSPEHKRGLLASEDDAAVIAYLERLDADAPDRDAVTLDDVWEPVHRSLTDGYCRTDNGDYPLALAVLGGRQLHDGTGFIVSYVAPGEVRDLVDALDEIDEAEFADRYSFIDEDDYDEALDDEGLKAAWAAFATLRDFYERAATQGRATVFVTEQ